MYTIFKNFRFRDAVLTDLPSFAVALVTAELFYKFHSFTLECLAFLGTWFAISCVFAQVVKLLPVRVAPPGSSSG